MKKFFILGVVSLVIFTGCQPSQKSVKEHQEFIKKYGDTDVYVCENGFLVNRYNLRINGDYASHSRLQKDDNNIPIRCSGVKTNELVGIPSGADIVTVNINE